MVGVESVVLWVHVAAGVLAVLAGAVALATRKGGDRHRRAGRGFVAAMAVVVGTVPPLLALEPTTLRGVLTLVAVFSGYFAFSGFRAVPRRRPAGFPTRADRAAAAAVVVACVGLGGWGGALLAAGRQFGVVLVVFGAIGVALGVADVRRFGDDREEPWKVSHLGRMVAAFVATVSAVSAVNLTPVLGVAAWLWPTAVGVPAIWYLQARHADVGPLSGRLPE